MSVASDPSGVFKERITHIKWFNSLTLLVFPKILVGIAFIHPKILRL